MGETPIKWAICNGHLEIVQILARSKGILQKGRHYSGQNFALLDIRNFEHKILREMCKIEIIE